MAGFCCIWLNITPRKLRQARVFTIPKKEGDLVRLWGKNQSRWKDQHLGRRFKLTYDRLFDRNLISSFFSFFIWLGQMTPCKRLLSANVFLIQARIQHVVLKIKTVNMANKRLGWRGLASRPGWLCGNQTYWMGFRNTETEEMGRCAGAFLFGPFMESWRFPVSHNV